MTIITPGPTDIITTQPDSLAALFAGQSVAVEVAGGAPYRAPTLEDALAAWDDAKIAWLKKYQARCKRAGKESNTVAVYRAAWNEFFAWIGIYPWRISRIDAMRWVDHLRSTTLSAGSVNLKLAALSSFYVFCETEYTTITPEGREVPLHNYRGEPSPNPFGHVARAPVTVDLKKKKHLSGDEAKALLDAVDRRTLKGKMDFAFIRLILYTGYRNTEAREMRWGDIVIEDGKAFYLWLGKGSKSAKEQIAPPAWDAICEYLKAAGRWDAMTPEDYIFTAQTETIKRLRLKGSGRKVVPDDWQPGQSPISCKEANRIVKRYARLAGLDPDKIHVHTLRHSTAMGLKKSGYKLEEVADKLHHSNLDTTRIYDHMEGSDDSMWSTLQSRFKW